MAWEFWQGGEPSCQKQEDHPANAWQSSQAYEPCL